MQCAGTARAAHAAAEWAVWTGVWSLEEVEDITQLDQLRMLGQRVSAAWSARTLDDSRHRKRRQDLRNKWSLQSARSSDFFCTQARHASVENFSESARGRDGTFSLLSVQTDLLCGNYTGCADTWSGAVGSTRPIDREVCGLVDVAELFMGCVNEPRVEPLKDASHGEASWLRDRVSQRGNGGEAVDADAGLGLGPRSGDNRIGAGARSCEFADGSHEFAIYLREVSSENKHCAAEVFERTEDAPSGTTPWIAVAQAEISEVDNILVAITDDCDARAEDIAQCFDRSLDEHAVRHRRVPDDPPSHWLSQLVASKAAALSADEHDWFDALRARALAVRLAVRVALRHALARFDRRATFERREAGCRGSLQVSRRRQQEIQAV